MLVELGVMPTQRYLTGCIIACSIFNWIKEMKQIYRPPLSPYGLLYSPLIHHPLEQKLQWCTSRSLCRRALWCPITNTRMWKQTAFFSVVSISSPMANSSQPLVSAKQIIVQNKTRKPLLGKSFRHMGVRSYKACLLRINMKIKYNIKRHKRVYF